MGASSVEGTGKGSVPIVLRKPELDSNVKKTLEVNSSVVLPKNIDVVILRYNEEDDITIDLPAPQTKIGSEITFISKCQNNHGNSIYINQVFGGTYNFTNSCIIFKLISDGEEWVMSDWYNYD